MPLPEELVIVVHDLKSDVISLRPVRVVVANKWTAHTID